MKIQVLHPLPKLDPFSAVSLVSNVVQFVQFSGELISKVRETNRFGSTVDTQALNTLTRDLENFTRRIRDRPTAPSLARPVRKDEQVVPQFLHLVMGTHD